MDYINRKSMLYKTAVEYGDYTINHVLGCSHGCKYPCYAMLMAKRFGRVKDYDEWCNPRLVSNAIEILKKEIPKFKNDIKSVHLCFTTDPFMCGYKEVSDMTIRIIELLNNSNIKCTALTKGILPTELQKLSLNNEYGITLVSLDENFRKQYEPNTASFESRIKGLKQLHSKGFKTWVSIEPYPTPNIIEQDLDTILDKLSFVDKIIFGKLNYNPLVTKYKNSKSYFNELASTVINFCQNNNIGCHIKNGTYNE